MNENTPGHSGCRAIKTTIIGVTAIGYQCLQVHEAIFNSKQSFIMLVPGGAGQPRLGCGDEASNPAPRLCRDAVVVRLGTGNHEPLL